MYFQLLEFSLCHTIKIVFCLGKCGGVIRTLCPESIIQKDMNQHNGTQGHCWWPSFPWRWGWMLRISLILSPGGSTICMLRCTAFKGLALGYNWAGFRRSWSLNSSGSACISQLCGWQLLLVGKAWIYFKVIVALSPWQQAAATSLAHYPPLPLDLSPGRSLGLLSE